MKYLLPGENTNKRHLYIFLCISMLMAHVSAGQTLKSAAANCGLNMGAAVADAPLQSDATYQNTLKQEYGMVVPENAMKMAVLKPTETGAYDYSAADRLVTFAQQNGMKVRGHTILWHNQIPAWVLAKTWTKASLLTFLKDYITNVVGHFKGKITEWDVANEFIDADNGNALRNSIWISTIGEAVLDSAFKWVNQADPSAKLYYNDYSAETMNSKSTAVYNLISRLKSRGVPIHGVGLEMHKSFDEALVATDPLLVELDQNIKRIGALGLLVSITELDLQVPLPADTSKNSKQATSYGNILQVALDNPSIVKSFVTWGFTDKYSWISCLNSLFGSALPFDASYVKKPAYSKLLSVLQNNCSGTTNKAPTVSLTAPAANASACAGATVTITASASDADGSVSRVDFFDGTTLLGTVTASPYTYSWTSATAGSHTITALATDNGGATATSTAVNITVNAASQPPAVTTPVSYCTGATASPLTATGTSLKWYTAATGGTGAATAPTPGTTTAGTTNYYVTQNVNGCESIRAIISVTVSAVPAAPAVSNLTSCQNDPAPVVSSGTGMLWYTAATGGTGSATPPVVNTGVVGTTSYYVSQMVNGCESTRSRMTVTVNASPSATITAAGPTTLPAGGSVVLNANTGTGLTYKWFNGTTQAGTGASYTATTAGNYTVEVTNGSGCKTTSAVTTVSINGNALPAVSITAPAGSASFIAPATINIAATASDADGSITKVEFFNGSMLLGTSTSSPYGFTWTAAVAGTYSITAVATDNLGASTTSAVLSITVNANQSSVISVTTSTDNSGTTGPSVTINVTATDPDGNVTKVEYLDGNTVVGTGTSEPYTFTMDNATTGNHVITIRVTDSNGGVTVSSPVTVTVSSATGILASSANNAPMRIYPNPAKGPLHVETQLPLTGASLRILDAVGAEIDVPVTIAGNDADLDVSSLVPGTYTLVLIKDASVIRKMITIYR